jgi:hypothetical protein
MIPLDGALSWIVEWYRGFQQGVDPGRLTRAQIERYETLVELINLSWRGLVKHKPNVVVLGTGMAGFGAANRLHAEGIAPCDV